MILIQSVFAIYWVNVTGKGMIKMDDSENNNFTITWLLVHHDPLVLLASGQ